MWIKAKKTRRYCFHKALHGSVISEIVMQMLNKVYF